MQRFEHIQKINFELNAAKDAKLAGCASLRFFLRRFFQAVARLNLCSGAFPAWPLFSFSCRFRVFVFRMNNFFSSFLTLLVSGPGRQKSPEIAAKS